MARSILTVEPVIEGWVVRCHGVPVEIRPTKFEAIGAASARAAREHAASGDATAVSVRMNTGQDMLIARHGWDGQRVRRRLR
mgnify:CR=1 FL=1